MKFSFDYPAGWTRMRNKPRSYGSVESKTKDGTTIESAQFGKLELEAGTERGSAKERTTMFNLIKEMVKNLSGSIPGFQLMSTGENRINGYPAYFAKFTVRDGAGPHHPALRPLRLRPAPAALPERVLNIFLLATSESSEVKSVADVGAKGGLLTVLKSLRFE